MGLNVPNACVAGAGSVPPATAMRTHLHLLSRLLKYDLTIGRYDRNRFVRDAIRFQRTDHEHDKKEVRV